ncbi:AurF N-oxygenase family protein [Teredinibacter turnerae]|uniref:AurF N-oxygenase family protein n=1 Tax=Teredinibacter turnerae TaxID=2426 RepID=UPI0003705390|nr:diiron oxygenase [Teredinibacter turnerae]
MNMPKTSSNDYDDSVDEAFDNQSFEVLEQLAEHWELRAGVKKKELNPEITFDAHAPDFLPELLPFHNHDLFLSADSQVKSKALSCGWVAYNEKTIDIESYIVSPSCLDILYGRLPQTQNSIIKWTASETLTDEAYHVLLVTNTCRITRQRRGLETLKLPTFDLVRFMRREMAMVDEEWKKRLINLATATVSEVFVSDYLSLIADAEHIQPINRLTTDVHRKDEMAHSSIFKHLMKIIYPYLTQKEQDYLAEILPKPVSWFASQELDVWESMLSQIRFPNYQEMIADCRSEHIVNLGRIDYSGLTTLADELGILRSQRGQDSFGEAGLQ